MDFLYCGEANVYQENLDAFLALAEELKLKGLTEGETEHGDSKGPVRTRLSDFQEEIRSWSTPPPTFHRKEQHVPTAKPKASFQSNETERTVSLQTTESGPLDEKIKSMMDPSGNVLTRKNGKQLNAFICKVCGKEAEDYDVRRHIEANHLTNISHSCDICGKTSRSRNGLRQHTDKEHKR